jgi:hypothetical protein
MILSKLNMCVRKAEVRGVTPSSPFFIFKYLPEVGAFLCYQRTHLMFPALSWYNKVSKNGRERRYFQDIASKN